MKKEIILTVAHKEFDSSKIDSSCYKVIAVGGHDNIKHDYLDSIGDNIAIKNPTWCELTAMYWGYKNIKDVDIMGLVHYRRYFSKNTYSKHPYKYILNGKEIESILTKKKVILPTYYKKGVGNKRINLDDNVNSYNLNVLYKILEKKNLKYAKIFYEIAKSDWLCGGNMFISSKKDYDEFCEFLFPILNEFERILLDDNKMTPRMVGYVSEYLANVYFVAKYSEKEIARYDVVNTELYVPNSFKYLLTKLHLIKIIKRIKHKDLQQIMNLHN